MFSSSNNLTAVALQPWLYISGLNVSVASNTVIAIAPGQCRDANDNIDMVYFYPVVPPYPNNGTYHNNGLIPAPQAQITNALAYSNPLLINSAVNGAGGLDQGTLAASTNYLIYLIADSRGIHQPSGILTLQSNAMPLIPYGYDSYRLIGCVSTDASTHFTAASVLNAVNYKGFFVSPAVSVLSGGNATSFTAIDLSTPIPTTTDPFVIANLVVTFIPSAAGDIVQFRPTGSSATTNLTTITGQAAGVAQTQYIVQNVGVGSSKPEIDYKVSVSGDSVSVSVAGYYLTLS